MQSVAWIEPRRNPGRTRIYEERPNWLSARRRPFGGLTVEMEKRHSGAVQSKAPNPQSSPLRKNLDSGFRLVAGPGMTSLVYWFAVWRRLRALLLARLPRSWKRPAPASFFEEQAGPLRMAGARPAGVSPSAVLRDKRSAARRRGPRTMPTASERRISLRRRKPHRSRPMRPPRARACDRSTPAARNRPR